MILHVNILRVSTGLVCRVIFCLFSTYMRFVSTTTSSVTYWHTKISIEWKSAFSLSRMNELVCVCLGSLLLCSSRCFICVWYAQRKKKTHKSLVLVGKAWKSQARLWMNKIFFHLKGFFLNNIFVCVLLKHMLDGVLYFSLRFKWKFLFWKREMDRMNMSGFVARELRYKTTRQKKLRKRNKIKHKKAWIGFVFPRSCVPTRF